MTSRRSPTVASSALALALLLGTADAMAQNAAMAEKLFQDGKALMDKKSYPEACPKLAESNRLDPGSGTALLLGACHEAAGNMASAWAAYTEAISLARRDGNAKREKAATARAKAIESKIAHVTFVVDPAAARAAGLELRLDGAVIGSAGWSRAPIDPGKHALDVSAPNKQKWSSTFTVDTQSGAESSVTVPALADVSVVQTTASTSTTATTSTGPPHASSSPLRPVGIAIGVVGLASVVAGGVFGALAMSASSDAKSRCSLASCTDADAVRENDRAKTFADVSTITIAVGAGALVVGVILFAIAPRSAEKKVAFFTGLGAGRAVGGIGGAF